MQRYGNGIITPWSFSFRSSHCLCRGLTVSLLRVCHVQINPCPFPPPFPLPPSLFSFTHSLQPRRVVPPPKDILPTLVPTLEPADGLHIRHPEGTVEVREVIVHVVGVDVRGGRCLPPRARGEGPVGEADLEEVQGGVGGEEAVCCEGDLGLFFFFF